MVKFNDLTDSQKTDKRARFDILSKEIDDNVAGDTTIAGRVSDLETAVGSATGDTPSGLAKDVSDLQAAVGDATTEDTLVYDTADIKTYISEILTANSLTDPRANAGNGEE